MQSMGPLSQCCLLFPMDHQHPYKGVRYIPLKVCPRPTEGLGISWLALQFFPSLHIFSIQYLLPPPPFPHFSYFPIFPRECCWEPCCRLCREFLGLEKALVPRIVLRAGTGMRASGEGPFGNLFHIQSQRTACGLFEWQDCVRKFGRLTSCRIWGCISCAFLLLLLRLRAGRCHRHGFGLGCPCSSRKYGCVSEVGAALMPTHDECMPHVFLWEGGASRRKTRDASSNKKSCLTLLDGASPTRNRCWFPTYRCPMTTVG